MRPPRTQDDVRAQSFGDVVPLFGDDNPAERLEGSQVRLTRRLWERLTLIAERETAIRKQRSQKGVISRNDVIQRFLELACDHYENEEGISAPDGTKRSRRK
jgi:hypothetical protein